jgi:hypothetical protein
MIGPLTLQFLPSAAIRRIDSPVQKQKIFAAREAATIAASGGAHPEKKVQLR